MPSFISTFVIAASIILVSSQESIDPNSVPLATRQKWCSSQTSSCPELCLQINATSSPEENSCDATSLTFACVCSNGLSPNASQYSLTIPYFICTEFDQQCVAACGSNNTCSAACRDDHPCGAQTPVRVNVTSTTTSASPSATSGSSTSGTSGTPTVFNGFGGTTTSASSSSDKNAGKMVFDVGASYGLAIVLAGVFAGFSLL